MPRGAEETKVLEPQNLSVDVFAIHLEKLALVFEVLEMSRAEGDFGATMDGNCGLFGY